MIKFPQPTLVRSDYRDAGARDSMRQREPLRHALPFAVAIVTLFLLSLTAAAQPPSKKVLILTGSDPNQPGFAIITRKIVSTLRDGSPTRVEMVYELQQELVNPPDSPERDQELIEYLEHKYHDRKFDLILAMVATRLRLLIEKKPELFANVPKVFYDFDTEREATNRSLGPNITGVWANLDLYKTLDLALALYPGTRKVVVISGSGRTDQVVRERAQTEFHPYQGRVEFSYFSGETIDELKVHLAALPKDTVVIFLSLTTDRMGHNYSGPEALSMFAPASSAPIFGNADTLMGLGIVGGNLLDFEGTGARIGSIGLRVLAGERPEQIPQETAPRVVAVDWRELQRWGISQQSLPPGSVVRFRQPSFWELYKEYIIGLIAAVIIEALLIAWLLFLRARRRQAENENLRLAQLAQTEHHRLNEIVSNVPGIVWETVIDPATKQRKTTFISDYIRNMLGYEPEEWLAAPDGFGMRIMSELDRDAVNRDIEAVLASGKEAVTEFRWTTKSGKTVWTESHLRPMSNGNGTIVGLRGVTLDITERKLAEESLRESEERSRRAQQAARVGTWEWDAQTGNAVWSDMIWDLLGVKKGEVPTTHDRFVEFMHPEDRETNVRKLQSMLANGNDDYYDEFRIVHPNGKVVWLSASGRVVRASDGTPERMIGVNIDITKRKLAEAKARETQEKEAAILSAIPDLMFWQTRDGVYLDYHASEKENLLLPPEQYLGKNMSEILPPELAKTFTHYFQRAFETGETQVVEYALQMADGEHWYESRLVSTGNNILSVVRDITERKRSLDQLRESEERFGKAFQANPQPMSLTSIPDCRYIDVNQSFLAMSGYTREEVIGRTSLELNIWETPELHTEFLNELERQGSIANIETKFRTRSGSFRILLSSAEPLEIAGEQCLLVASSDITESVQAQEALRESEQRFRNVADNAPVMIWVTGADKMCTYFNKQGLDFAGLTMDQALGYGWVNSIHPDDSDYAVKTYESSFDARKPFSMEYRLRRVDGAYRWVIATGTARFSEAGEFLGYIGSCMDIHDRKASEEALHTAHAEVSRLKNQLQEENIYLQEEIKLKQNFGEIVGRSDALRYVLFKIEQVAPTETTVLITGDTGTGKELVAHAIHSASLRKDRPLVKVNCAALSASLIESELFGHEKGAFTGATARKLGRFERADGATLFLDEIGELPMELQVKLLRVIQEGEFERLGSSTTIKVNVRIIAATNRNLNDAVAHGRFREDLWYRLNVFPITVPPLRQRREDIPLLVEHFVRRFSKSMGKEVTAVSPATFRILQDYAWPGNVRELANVIERGVINTRGSVLEITDHLEIASEESRSATKTLEEMERDYIIRILEARNWRIDGRSGAARILGMHPSTLRTRMSKLGIQKPKTFA